MLSAFGTENVYRIVYIALTTFILLVFDIRQSTTSARAWREVGAVQLPADTLLSLRDNSIVDEVQLASNGGIKEVAWARQVRYFIPVGVDC